MDAIRREIECRADGRRLVGDAMVYGDLGDRGERFEPGSIDVGEVVELTRRHNELQVVAHTGGGGLEIDDLGDRIEVRAELPQTRLADRVLAEVKSGASSALSVEFIPRTEKREAGIRVITGATLVAVGIVPQGSYPAARVEARNAAWWLY